mmetsp:Transcript_148/g.408  ORF Transcript_148/g.408 Transcript_148/m.408 type:complete len:113 (-) Transcript_148:905-1243(-)
MIYLNDNFEGGATKFYNGGQRHYREGEPRYVTDSLQPVAGDALVFDSAITHEGGTVTKGCKYILRTEIMYTWTSSNKSTDKAEKKIAPDYDSAAEFLPDENHDWSLSSDDEI